MNELETISVANLPALRTDEVKACVDLVGDAIQSAKAKLSAAKHIGADKSIIDEMSAQINDYSALKLRAEMELGKRTAAIGTRQGARNDFVDSEYKVTKGDTLAEIGVTRDQASSYERMAKNEQEVENYIVETVAQGKAPTRRGAMERLKPQERRRTSKVFLPKEHDYHIGRAERGEELPKPGISRDVNYMPEYGFDDLMEEARGIISAFLKQLRRLAYENKEIVSGNPKEFEKALDDAETEIKKLKEEF